MEKTNFVGIGTTKSATTWIFECLNEHPEICGSITKETSFFIGQKNKNLKDYLKFFKNRSDKKVFGEFSPQYLTHEEVPENIKNLLPNSKIIVCLRNPIERFLSETYFRLYTGRYSKKQEKDILKKLDSDAIERGFYYKYLKKYFEIFGRENVLVLIYRDIKIDKLSFIQKIYEFIGVDKSFVPKGLEEKKNVTAKNYLYFPWVNRVTYKIHRILGGTHFAKFLKIFGINKLGAKIRKINRRNVNELDNLEKKIDEKTRSKIFNFYKEDIYSLEKMIGRDLSFWK